MFGPYEAVRIDRKCENTYEIFDNRGRGTQIVVKDHHPLHLARMLGFEDHYPCLEGHLELLTESWVGLILSKVNPMLETSVSINNPDDTSSSI